MFFGRNEEAGLRCVYHGWKFDVDGNCIDMPNCVEGETFKDRVKTWPTPTFEAAGHDLGLHGAQRQACRRCPSSRASTCRAANVYVMKYLLNCNYAQTLENEFDTSPLGVPAQHADRREHDHDRLVAHLGQGRGGMPAQNANAPPRRDRAQVEYTLDAVGEIVDTPFGSALVRRVADPKATSTPTS